MNKLLMITVGILLFLTTSCDSGGDGNSVDDESALQGLWALSQECEEDFFDYDDSSTLTEECGLVSYTEIDDEYLFIDNEITYDCNGVFGDECLSGTYTLSGSLFEVCEDTIGCNDAGNNPWQCSDTYGCWYNEWSCNTPSGCCLQAYQWENQCRSWEVSFSEDYEIMTLSYSYDPCIGEVNDYDACQNTLTRIYYRIGDSLEDYEYLSD